MIDIVDELAALVAKFDENRIDYALCGGMAMGVHGFMRMTVDIDFIIQPKTLDRVFAIARELGYSIRGKDLSFKDGAVEIRRITKIDPDSGDVLPLDFLLITPAVQNVWDTRIKAEWERGELSVVSAAGLVEMKKLRNSLQDIADIARLTEENQDAGS